MKIPAPHNFARITNHNKPRYQLYQPGFNNTNSCWLEGSWITIPKEEWYTKKTQHIQMYSNIKEEKKKQYYRGLSIAIDDMTEAQKQAWKHYSGTTIIHLIDKNGKTLPCRIELAANKIRISTIKWIKKHQWKIPRITIGLNRIEINQQKKYNIPEEIIINKTIKIY